LHDHGWCLLQTWATIPLLTVGTGALILSRHPGHAVGWRLCGVGRVDARTGGLSRGSVAGLGSARCRRAHAGTEDVTRTFRFVASWFSDLRSYDWELLASDVIGDCAYTVAIERYTASREGRPVAPTELRATHVYRRENGQWRAVHRHADLIKP